MAKASGEDELGGVKVMQNDECRAQSEGLRWIPTEEAGVRREPRRRLEQIRCMSLEELAERLLTLHDGDAGSYCRMKDECVQALEENHPETVTEANCLECIKEWLMEEV